MAVDPNTPGYVLYELVARADDKDSQVGHSPYVNKTKADLAFLGVPYISIKLTFLEIRDQLAKLTGNNAVTVPTLQTPKGEYITDSWAIAEYLDKAHGTPERNLFRNPSTKVLSRLLDVFLDTDVVLSIRLLFRPLFYTLCDADNAAYFIKHKYAADQALMDAQLQALGDPAAVQALGVPAREKLQVLEKTLKEGKASGGPFLLGDKPSHADASLWGWYASSQVNKRVVDRELWANAELPHLTAWVKAVAGVVGEVTFAESKIVPKGY